MSSLQLVGEQVLEETLRFKGLATKLRRYCDEELSALHQRMGVLLGDANLEEDGNPLSPSAVCDAYQQACHEFDPNVHVRAVLLRLFDDHVLDEIRSIYKAVNALLVDNGILPRIRSGVSRTDSARRVASGPGPAGKETQEPAKGEAPAEQELFSLLHKLVGGNQVAPQGQAAQNPMQGAELLDSHSLAARGRGRGRRIHGAAGGWRGREHAAAA